MTARLAAAAETVELTKFGRRSPVHPEELLRQAVPCGTDVEQAEVARLIESEGWDFVGPVPEWHDTCPVTVEVVRASTLPAFRRCAAGDIVNVRSDSPPHRALLAVAVARDEVRVRGWAPRWLSEAVASMRGRAMAETRYQVHKWAPTSADLRYGGQVVYRPDGTFDVVGSSRPSTEAVQERELDRQRRAYGNQQRQWSPEAPPAVGSAALVYRPPVSTPPAVKRPIAE